MPRAVAVRLLDLDVQAAVDPGEQAVDPHPPPGGEVDGDHADLLPGGQVEERISLVRQGVHVQCGVVAGEEAGAATRGDVQSRPSRPRAVITARSRPARLRLIPSGPGGGERVGGEIKGTVEIRAFL